MPKQFNTPTIGLTGGIASGKTAASDWFAKQSIPIIDTDVIARQVVEPCSSCLNEITKHFGGDILNNGELDRAKLRAIIFSDNNEKKWLEALLHPAIRSETIAQLKAEKSAPYQILVSPLLFETNQQSFCDASLLIYVNEQTQIERLLQRDGKSLEDAHAIIAAQMPLSQKLTLATWSIDNNQDILALEQQLAKFHQERLDDYQSNQG